MEKIYLGRHLLLDAICGVAAREKLADFSLFYTLLESLPKLIGMKSICPPYVMKYLDPPDSEWGISSMVLISTSHFSFHTFPERGAIHFDCFSCRPFDEKLVVEYLNGVFNFVDSKIQVIDR